MNNVAEKQIRDSVEEKILDFIKEAKNLPNISKTTVKDVVSPMVNDIVNSLKLELSSSMTQIQISKKELDELREAINKKIIHDVFDIINNGGHGAENGLRDEIARMVESFSKSTIDIEQLTTDLYNISADEKYQIPPEDLLLMRETIIKTFRSKLLSYASNRNCEQDFKSSIDTFAKENIQKIFGETFAGIEAVVEEKDLAKIREFKIKEFSSAIKQIINGAELHNNDKYGSYNHKSRQIIDSLFDKINNELNAKFELIEDESFSCKIDEVLEELINNRLETIKKEDRFYSYSFDTVINEYFKKAFVTHLDKKIKERSFLSSGSWLDKLVDKYLKQIEKESGSLNVEGLIEKSIERAVLNKIVGQIDVSALAFSIEAKVSSSLSSSLAKEIERNILEKLGFASQKTKTAPSSEAVPPAMDNFDDVMLFKA